MNKVRGSLSLRLAFVPEQVNIPLMLALEHGIFSKHGLTVSHVLVPEGTGRMLAMVESGEADIAFTVTDATMVAKAKGSNIRLIGTFVESPLVWVAATSSGSGIASLADLRTRPGNRPIKVGVSR
jgi:sulfonate transport system substrate-binding protein